MLATTAPRPRIVTHRIGGLSAIQSSDVQAVIWKRDLAPSVKEETHAASGVIRQVLDFVTLGQEPEGRIQQHLRKAQVESRFLAPDIALLVTAFGELSRTRRIRVRLGAEAVVNQAGPREGIRLICAYQRAGVRRKPSDGHVMVFRGDWQGANLEGFFLRLDAVTERV